VVSVFLSSVPFQILKWTRQHSREIGRRMSTDIYRVSRRMKAAGSRCISPHAFGCRVRIGAPLGLESMFRKSAFCCVSF